MGTIITIKSGLPADRKLRVVSSATNALNIPVEVAALPIVQTMELDYQFSNDQWLFSLNGVTQTVKNLLDDGYVMQVQLVRFQPKGNYNKKSTSNGYLSSSSKRMAKPSYPNFIGVINLNTFTTITSDRKAKIGINNQQSNIFQNMNLTTWVNNMIKYESYNKWTSAQLRAITTPGYWFSRFKFIILINDTKYALTNKLLQMNYYNNGNINQTNLSNIIQTSNLITVNVGQV
jgi:hypothetical protein